MVFLTKCLNEDRAEVSYFSAIFSLFSAISVSCAVFNDQWITIRPRNFHLSFSLDKSLTNINLACSEIGARLFWSVNPSEYVAFLNKSVETNSSFIFLKNLLYINCITPAITNLFYCAISLCFAIATFSIFAALFHILLPSFKFLDFLRKCAILEICNVIIMFIICFLTWYAKYKIELQLSFDLNAEVCVGNGIFYIICSGAFSSIAALFSFYQNKLVGRVRRAKNQRFICTRALRSWRDHIQNSRILSENRPNELERYLLDATLISDAGLHSHQSETISSTMTVVPINNEND